METTAMSEVVKDLYGRRMYPAMSHPVADPAVVAVAAALAGLDATHPAEARILEIGCCSGHNLIPLAMRWPESRFTGVDLSERGIAAARELAAIAGLGNIAFHAGDIRDFRREGEGFDFIIAHGFFSWVEDEVKLAMLDFCRENLASNGVAVVSFNVTAGWRARFPVVLKARAILEAGAGDLMTALRILSTVTDGESTEMAVIDDMLAKGEDILSFDDFGPVNDPWSFRDFVALAARHGLRWLGESDPGKNLPEGIDAGVLREIADKSPDPLAFQDAADEAAGRTFRAGLLCRSDAALADSVSLERIFEFSARAGSVPEDPEDLKIRAAIAADHPLCLSLAGLEFKLPGADWNTVARRVYDGMHHGWILPRIEPVWFDPEVPEFPKLNAFRLECARRMLPVVDVWHKPCSFPKAHYQVLAAMDGTRSSSELREISRAECPELAFGPWLSHLAERGMFA